MKTEVLSAAGRSAPALVRAGGIRKMIASARSGYHRDLVLHLVRRELAIRYRGSVLGWLWSLAPALIQLVVTEFFFTRVLRAHVANFPVFLLIGILAWTQFASGLQLAANVLPVNRNLVLRPGFPTALLPVISALVALTDYLIALPILFVALAATSGVPVESLLLPVLLLIQLVLVAGIGLVVAPLQLFFRDTRQLIGLVIMAGFWLTPIFYKQKQVPGTFRPIYDANPMAHLIAAQRQILMEGRFPSGLALGLVALGSLLVFACGCAVFASLRFSLPERL